MLLMLAAIEGNTTIADLLVSRGADVNRANKFGDTALSLAVAGNHSIRKDSHGSRGLATPERSIRSSKVRMEAWRQWLLGGRKTFLCEKEKNSL